MPVTIALADDHLLVRKGIRMILESIEDFRVVNESSNGRELCDAIAMMETLPDLVLLDVNMPVMDGQEAVNELRGKYPNLRLIALSVNDQLSIIREIIRLGANAYLIKDSSPETFYKVLIEVHNKGFYYDKMVIESLLVDENKSSGNHRSPAYYSRLLDTLSNRELEFIRLCCSELTYKEIAEQMGVSQRTVDGYRENAFDKLNLKSRSGLVLFAFNSGLISDK